MTLDQIRSKAPIGATHYIDHQGITYHRKIGFFWYEITQKGNYAIDISWIHKLKPLKGED